LLFDQDECWFSRFAQPDAHAWALAGEELRLIERQPAKGEQNKALACFGALRHDGPQVYLYFSQGQPDSDQTLLFLPCLLDIARQEGKRVAVIIWDHASWHTSKKVKSWVRNHNLRAKREGDVRLLVFLLPKKSPWLNPIEPRWVHAKRQVCEPNGELTVCELQRRLCAHFETAPLVPTLKESASVLH
jgi:transposase